MTALVNNKFLVAIVLFKQELLISVAVNSLIEVLEKNIEQKIFEILVIDNSPGIPTSKLIVQHGVRYHALGKNEGLPLAYNLALDIAVKEKFTHLITLDQDSVVSSSYIDTVLRHVQSTDDEIVVWVPTVVSRNRIVSPFFFNLIGLPRYIFRSKGCSAINSFSVYDVSYLKKANGFNNYYWLDGLDFSIFSEIEKNGKRCQLLPAVVDHELSLLSETVSFERMENIARYESTFFCEYMQLVQIIVGLSRVFLRGVKLLKSPKKLSKLIRYLMIIIAGSVTGFRRRINKIKYAK